MHLQYLQGGDLVLQEFLGLVEVRQHVLGLPVVDAVHLDQVPLVLLGHLLLVDPGGDARGGDTHSTQERVRLLREQGRQRPTSSRDAAAEITRSSLRRM